MPAISWALLVVAAILFVYACVCAERAIHCTSYTREAFCGYTPGYVACAGRLAAPVTDDGSIAPYDGLQLDGRAAAELRALSGEALGNARGFRSAAPRGFPASTWALAVRAPDGTHLSGSRRRTAWVGSMLAPSPPCGWQT